MNVFVSVVSHGHGQIIKRLGCLIKLAERYNVVVKVNKCEKDLVDYLVANNIKCIDHSYGLGFGHNNNIVFNYCSSNLGMGSNDYFIVLNPDVVISNSNLSVLIEKMEEDKKYISAINLFKNYDTLLFDNSIRHFPSLFQFVTSFLGLGNSTIIDKSKIDQSCNVDWAAGSFLAFKVNHYADLGGFDEKFFMYCEDIDICYRSCKLGHKLTYYPQVKALHLAKHANRKVFSKHFYWHLSSVFRFLRSKMGLTIKKSSVL